MDRGEEDVERGVELKLLKTLLEDDVGKLELR